MRETGTDLAAARLYPDANHRGRRSRGHRHRAERLVHRHPQSHAAALYPHPLVVSSSPGLAARPPQGRPAARRSRRRMLRRGRVA